MDLLDKVMGGMDQRRSTPSSQDRSAPRTPNVWGRGPPSGQRPDYDSRSSSDRRPNYERRDESRGPNGRRPDYDNRSSSGRRPDYDQRSSSDRRPDYESRDDGRRRQENEHQPRANYATPGRAPFRPGPPNNYSEPRGGNRGGYHQAGFKRDFNGRDGPDAKKRYGEMPFPRSNQDASNETSSNPNDSFAPFSTIGVQLNSWEIDVSKMDEVIQKLLFKTTLIQSDGRRFELSLGLSTVAGDVNRQQRRQAQCLLFVAWFRQNKKLFNGHTNPDIAAYDAADTVYIGSSHFSGGVEEHVFVLEEEHLSREEWKIVNRISRRTGSTFEVRIKSIGQVYTRGPQALTEENRPEFTRCLETISNQILHNDNFLLYSSGTYPVREGVLSSPDDVTDIKAGFSKVSKVVEGADGQPKAIMTVDTAKSAFYKSSTVLKFFTSKMEQFSGRGGGHGGGYGGGGYGGGRGGGHGGGHRRDNYNENQNRDQRQNQNPEKDYDEKKVSNYQEDYRKGRISERDLEAMSRALKGLECDPLHLTEVTANRSIIVDGLSRKTADKCTFTITRNGKEEKILVIDYFLDKYQYKIKYPHLPLVVSKRRKAYDFYPMEVLMIIPGQRIKGSQMSPEIQSQMTGKFSVLPLQHIDQSRKILQDYLQLGDRSRNRYMEAFKISIQASQPIKARAKILAPPYAKFADQQLFAPDPNRGTVAFKLKTKFVQPARIRSILIINYDERYNGVEQFANALGRHCSEQGIRLDARPSEWKIRSTHPDDASQTKLWMEKALKDKVTIVIGIVAEKRPDMHDTLKYYEEKLGQVTLQICTETAKKMVEGHGGTQTVQNVMRKLNPKCGGTNFYVETPETIAGKVVCKNVVAMEKKLYEKTQFIGFEVSHTGSRTKYDIQKVIFDGDPTAVGVAYSLKHSTQLGGFSYYQDTRLHQLTRIEQKLKICLDAYEKSSQCLPETIVVYRVGSGEGDYAQIRDEVDEMRAAAAKQKKGYAPKFLVVLAQRHSHCRVFPEHINGRKAAEQNVPSGTCVEDIGSAHGLDEFLLCCQTPLIGTVRPTRYTVIVNDAGWTKNEVMNVTYHLSFGHQVSYAPPAVPNVLYAAANLAKRGHNNYKTCTKLGDIKHECNSIKQKHEHLSETELEKVFADDFITKISDALNDLTVTGRNFWA